MNNLNKNFWNVEKMGAIETFTYIWVISIYLATTVCVGHSFFNCSVLCWFLRVFLYCEDTQRVGKVWVWVRVYIFDHNNESRLLSNISSKETSLGKNTEFTIFWFIPDVFFLYIIILDFFVLLKITFVVSKYSLFHYLKKNFGMS